MRSIPADQLADRYPGHLAGTIGAAALPSPNSLVIIIGRTPAQLARTPNTVQVTSITDAMPGGFVYECVGRGCPAVPNPKGLNYFPTDSGGTASCIDLILSVVALAILTPVLIFGIFFLLRSLLRLTGARLATLRRDVRLRGTAAPMVAPGAAYYLLTAAES